MKKTENKGKKAVDVAVVAIMTIFSMIIGIAFDVPINVQAYSNDELSNSIKDRDIPTVVELYNKATNNEEPLDGRYEDKIKEMIQGIATSWSERNTSYEEAIDELLELKEINNDNISIAANDNIEYITREQRGNELYHLAEMKFENAEYLDAITDLNSIEADCSIKSEADKFVNLCEEILLTYVSSPTTVEEYEEYQETVDTYIDAYPSKVFLKRKEQLEEEKPMFVRALPIMENAKDDLKEGEYKKSFNKLEAAIAKDKDNRFLVELLDAEHNYYVIEIAQKINIKVKQEDYEAALKIIDTAEDNYKCADFKSFREYVKEEKSFFYKAKNRIVSKTKLLYETVTSDDFNIKDAARSTGRYIKKSGKKLLFGDYNSDDNTALAMSGEIAASVAGVDAPLDIRDLSYDISHWGKGDYFLVKLGVDAIGVIPVVGALKHIKHADDFKLAAKRVSGFFNSITETGKEFEKIISNTVKVTDNGAEVTGTLKRVAGYCKKTDTINQDLLGKTHPETNVKYVMKRDIPNGVKGVVPDFDSKMNMQLPNNLCDKSIEQQYKWLNKKLKKKIKKKKYRKLFTKSEIKTIKKGKLPSKYVYHHDLKKGRIQIVDRKIHEKTGHTGGMSIWGKGYN